MPCIKAFLRLHAARPQTALLLAGEVVSEDLERVLQIEAGHPAIRRLGHLSERDLFVAGAAVDCCLNLRYPGVGETSAIAVRLMGQSKPVIVTDNAENSDFPPTTVLRVSPGVAEAQELFDHIVISGRFSGAGGGTSGAKRGSTSRSITVWNRSPASIGKLCATPLRIRLDCVAARGSQQNLAFHRRVQPPRVHARRSAAPAPTCSAPVNPAGIQPSCCVRRMAKAMRSRPRINRS